jgi:mono/diheme cytochrome c family protein
MKKTYIITGLLALSLLGLSACGGGEQSGENEGGRNAVADESGLTQEQIEKGIGPITSVTLGPIDEALAARGAELFEVKCSACHKLDSRYIGPPLGEVTARRTPEFIMNMILNPEEMMQKHPVVKELLAQYMAQMANQSLTEEEARAILEYLRKVEAEGGSSQP